MSRPIRGFRYADTLRGDTLQAIALRELGDTSRWVDLAQLNGLAPPYIIDSLEDLEDTESRVLLTGQPIRIPAPGRAPTATASAVELFGRDIRLDGGLLVVESGDLALIEGEANLVQAIGHRLASHRKDLPQHPEYGNRAHELVGEGAGPTTNALAAAFFAACLKADPRIDRAEGVTASVAGDILTGSATAITIDGKPLPVGGE